MSEAKNDAAVDAALALIGEIGPDIGSVWRHRKGGAYRVVANALRESDLVPVVVYCEEWPGPAGFAAGVMLTWVRPLTEFRDGRFTMVSPAPERGGAS